MLFSSCLHDTLSVSSCRDRLQLSTALIERLNLFFGLLWLSACLAMMTREPDQVTELDLTLPHRQTPTDPCCQRKCSMSLILTARQKSLSEIFGLWRWWETLWSEPASSKKKWEPCGIAILSHIKTSQVSFESKKTHQKIETIFALLSCLIGKWSILFV